MDLWMSQSDQRSTRVTSKAWWHRETCGFCFLHIDWNGTEIFHGWKKGTRLCVGCIQVEVIPLGWCFTLRTDHKALTILSSIKGISRARRHISNSCAWVLCFVNDVYWPGSQNYMATHLCLLSVPSRDNLVTQAHKPPRDCLHNTAPVRPLLMAKNVFTKYSLVLLYLYSASLSTKQPILTMHLCNLSQCLMSHGRKLGMYIVGPFDAVPSYRSLHWQTTIWNSLSLPFNILPPLRTTHFLATVVIVAQRTMPS